MVSCDMEQALVVLLSYFSHVVALVVARSPAIVCAPLVRVFSTIEPAYCSETADECATADDDEGDGSSSTESHGDSWMEDDRTVLEVTGVCWLWMYSEGLDGASE